MEIQMFEAMEAVFERQSRRLDPSVANPVIVHKLDDIRRVIAEIDPSRNKSSSEIVLTTVMDTIEDGKKTSYNVSAPTKSKSKREMLLEGLEIVKRQLEIKDLAINKSTPIEINGVLMKPAEFGDNEKARMWVDPLVKHWLGAFRDGLMICWDIEGVRYHYNIWEHKLTRMKAANAE